MNYIIPDKVYKVLKWGCVLVLPALATCFSTIAGAWGMDPGIADAVATTITAVATFGGVVLGVSAATATSKEA